MTRCFQFSLAALFAVVTSLCAAFASPFSIVAATIGVPVTAIILLLAFVSGGEAKYQQDRRERLRGNDGPDIL